MGRLGSAGSTNARNVVIPDRRLGLPGAYDFAELLNYIESAELPQGRPDRGEPQLNCHAVPPASTCTSWRCSVNPPG